jgi:putative photosynthetic complex assembly protein 2
MDYALAILVAVGIWWLSTVVILYRAGLPAATFGRTLLGATVGALVGIWLLFVSRNDASSVGAYLAFFGGIALFGWHEVAYLFGFISGPRPEACPQQCSGWTRFVLGVKTCFYHEVAVVLTVLALAAFTWEAPNQVGLWTLVVLWLMRWSAKLNIFLGVRNLHVEFWPDHLAYLQSYTRTRPMNGLFPWSIIIATTIVTLLMVLAVNSPTGSGVRTGATLVATLLALATLEHWFLIVQLPDELLWQPGMRSRRSPRREAASTSGS